MLKKFFIILLGLCVLITLISPSLVQAQEKPYVIIVDCNLAKNTSTNTSNYFVQGPEVISEGGAAVTARQYYIYDGLGNIRFVTDSAGNKLQSLSYDPYGNQLTGNGSAFKYKGEQIDQAGLYFMRARYYDPITGRFISRDPVKGYLQDPRIQNGYDYALNNPVNLSDPKGENPIAVVGGVAGLLLTGYTVGGAIDGAINSCDRSFGGIVNGAVSGAGNALNDPIGQTLLGTAAIAGSLMTGSPQNNQGELEVSGHAALRMSQRGINTNQAQSTIINSQPFTYLHEGVIKTGYYDPITKIFVGTYNNQITTVINNVSQNYINNLINGK